MLKACKRVEIVIERAQLKSVSSMLDALPVGGYTVLTQAGGSGDRGPRRADDVTDTDENCVFIVAVEDSAVLESLLTKVTPMLKRYGGICLVTDAEGIV